VNSNIGHQHPKVVQAIKDQADKLCFAAPSFANDARSELAKLLSEITPGDLKCSFFTNAGADANENAIKIARMFTKKSKIITRYRSYHGATYGAIALTGDPRRPPVEPTMPGVVRILDPYCYRCPFGQKEGSCKLECAKHIEEVILYENPDTIAALLFESITGSNGVFIPPKEYFKEVRRICDKYGILFIADEVMAGFGRSGEWFAVNNFDVVPDIMTVAKGLTSAYAPLGAVAMKPEIAAAFDQRTFESGLTYTSHPVSLAAAVANINVMRDDKLVEHAAEMGPHLNRLLKDLGETHPSVGDVRSIGLFGIIELVRDRKTKEPMAPWNGSSPEMAAFRKTCLEHGLYVYTHWHTVLIIPPLPITVAQLEEGFAVLDQALAETDKAVK
jgi:taurine--2-oxoglutarate transaminase